jgi:hypothetical protein
LKLARFQLLLSAALEHPGRIMRAGQVSILAKEVQGVKDDEFLDSSCVYGRNWND